MKDEVVPSMKYEGCTGCSSRGQEQAIQLIKYFKNRKKTISIRKRLFLQYFVFCKYFLFWDPWSNLRRIMMMILTKKFGLSLALPSIAQTWWYQNNRKLRPFSENPNHLRGPAIWNARTSCMTFSVLYKRVISIASFLSCIILIPNSIAYKSNWWSTKINKRNKLGQHALEGQSYG